tara:strand:- start:1438 stop:1683 length:246 start_codon:yes stop_codon:yes gene_type:complete
MEERLKNLEKQLLELQTGVNKRKEKKTRPPTEYNMFMGDFIKEQRKKLGEKYNHKEAFKLGAAAWDENKNGKSKETPKEKS